ncbi:hypothetical protein [Natronomonas sp. EA1]|uniref:hypothetical protein n=1 Tax=Natronomonas sp. EA1 TaxID=3421655 RepID=UPI003EB91F77
MGLPGTIDPTVYEGLQNVLRRQPEVTSVTYEPDSISKRFLRARIDPARLSVPVGPEASTLDVEWRFVGEESFYRIHYADPNSGFNCGWHRDDDHPDLGPVHFQFEHPEMGSTHEPVQFEKTVPTEVLWEALDRLLDEQLPRLLSDD